MNIRVRWTYMLCLLLLGCGDEDNSVPLPTANFSASRDVIESGQSVTFQDESEGAPSSFHWIFARGIPNNSSERSPTVTYYTSGTWDVYLKVTNVAGSHEKTINGMIKVNPSTDEYLGGGGVEGSKRWTCISYRINGTERVDSVDTCYRDNQLQLTRGYAAALLANSCDLDQDGSFTLTTGSVITFDMDSVFYPLYPGVFTYTVVSIDRGELVLDATEEATNISITFNN